MQDQCCSLWALPGSPAQYWKLTVVTGEASFVVAGVKVRKTFAANVILHLRLEKKTHREDRVAVQERLR